MQLMSPKFTAPFNARAVLHDYIVDQMSDALCRNPTGVRLDELFKSGEFSTEERMSQGEWKWQQIVEGMLFGHKDLYAITSSDSICDIVITRDNDYLSPEVLIEVKTLSKRSLAHQEALRRIKCRNSDGTISRTDWRDLSKSYKCYDRSYRVDNTIMSYLSTAMQALGNQIYINKLLKTCLDIHSHSLGLFYVFAFTNQDSAYVNPLVTEEVASRTTFMLVKLQPGKGEYSSGIMNRLKDYYDELKYYRLRGKMDDPRAMQLRERYESECSHRANFLIEFSRPLMFDGLSEFKSFLQSADLQDVFQSHLWSEEKVLLHHNGILNFSAPKRPTFEHRSIGASQ